MPGNIKSVLRVGGPRVVVLAILWAVAAMPGRAQPASGADEATDNLPSSFRGQEAQMLALMDQHMPLLANIEKQLDATARELAVWDSVLRYRDNIPRFRDQAMDEVGQLRQTNLNQHNELMRLNMSWFGYIRQITAVYTRYGELKAVNRIDEHTKRFLLRHRELFLKIEGLVAKVNQNYVVADFLINTRLN